MMEIKAFIHKNPIAAVNDVLQSANVTAAGRVGGMHNVNVAIVQSLLKAMDVREQRYGVDLAQPVIQDYKLELLCEDHEAEPLVQAIASAGRTGQAEAGWVYVSDVISAIQIGKSPPRVTPLEER